MSAVSIEVPPAPRLVSLDALRGFDMFWIIGGDALAREVLRRGDWAVSATLIEQLEHVEWVGFRFYDLIFPLFLFLVGCVLPFSLDKYRERPAAAYARVARRTLLLVILGLLYNSLLQFELPIRSLGVLQRIGICYGCAALVYLHTRLRGQLVSATVILLGYWALIAMFPAPDYNSGPFTKEGNLSGFVDRHYLPGKILKEYYGVGDNEGLLSTIPAVGTVLIGALAGQWLRSSVTPWRKVGGLVAASVLALGSGEAWGLVFPVIKNIWTSSFVLVAAGWSLLLLALFYAVIDVLQWRRWSFFFVVIGMNAITIYCAQRVIDFTKIAQFFVGGLASHSGDFSRAVVLAGVLFAKWLFVWMLYRQRLFLRV